MVSFTRPIVAFLSIRTIVTSPPDSGASESPRRTVARQPFAMPEFDPAPIVMISSPPWICVVQHARGDRVGLRVVAVGVLRIRVVEIALRPLRWLARTHAAIGRVGAGHRRLTRRDVDVGRVRALVLARRPAGRRTELGADVLARGDLRVELRRVARQLGLGHGGELRRLRDLELERIEQRRRRRLLELHGQLVLAGVTAADRVDPDEVLALRVVELARS